MKLKIAQVIGLNTDQKAAQVTSSQREDTTLLAVIDLSSDDAFTKGRQILSELEDFYFDAEGSPAEKLKATFADAEKKLAEGQEFSLGLAVISRKVLYLIGKGNIEVYLKRLDKVSSLLSAGSAEIISGFISPADKILFLTKSLAAFLGDELVKTLDLPIDSFEEELEGKIGASETEDHGLAALAVEITEEGQIVPLADSSPTSPNIPNPSNLPNFPDQSMGLNVKTLFCFLLSKTSALVKQLSAYFPKSGRSRLILAVLLIIITFSGVGYKFIISKNQQKQAQVNQLLQQAKDDLNAAKGLSTLNPAEAKNKLASAKDKVSKALSLQKTDTAALDLSKQIEQDTPLVLQESSVSAFPLFLDLDLIKKNFIAEKMSLSDGKLLLLDPGVKTLVVLDLVKKSNQILAGKDQLGEAEAVSLNGGLAFIYSKDKGVLKIDSTNLKITTIAKSSTGFGKIADIYAFAGNIYLLDAGNPERSRANEASRGGVEGQIWKYLPVSSGYSDAREYLSKSVKEDFSEAFKMQIESSIYLLKKGGEILRFTKGDKDNFSYQGLPSGVKDPKSFFVSSDTDNLYLLDSGNSRLLILSKTGVFKSQMMGVKFATSSDLAVDEVGKKVYLLEGGKIYSVDLK